MDAIHALLKFLFRLAIALMLLSLVLWLVGLFIPTFKIRNIASLIQGSGDWLPAPGSISLLGNLKSGGEYGTVYTPGPAYQHNTQATYNNNATDVHTEYITYTQLGGQTVRTTVNASNIYDQSFNGITSAYTSKSLYLRNLSIYEGGHVYTGLTFTGEARESMFNNGKFPIIIADATGKVIGISIVEATSNWSIPGWVRFHVKINSVLPDKVPCTMVFQSGMSYQGQQPVRIMVPILCN